MTTLVATDLDQTVIYSRRAITRWGGDAAAVTAVETYREVDASFMTAVAAARLASLHDHAVVVPATTRTREQLARVRLPGGGSRYAIAANGGVLLVDGVADEQWHRRVLRALRGTATPAEVHAHALAVCHPAWTSLVRTAEDLFCYAVLDRARLPDGFVEAEAAWAQERGWRTSVQGRKLYWVPSPLTKGAALGEVARRTGAARVLAAGDSLLDADLLLAADAGIAARHGELVASGWSAPHVGVTDGRGVLAGEQVVDWFVEQVAAEVPAPR